MIRPATPADTPALLEMAAATGVFKPFEVDTLKEVLDDFHSHGADQGHRCYVLEEDGERLGFEYHSAEPMTEGTWTLWWIVVRPNTQGKGIGGKLIRWAEEDAKTLGARVIFLQTSSLPHSDLTRRFYLKQGYDQEARLRDFYAAGDDQIVFRKAL
ncbi:MAG TPA: GNAT family N-acetyltransferase [Gemmataceae bacterium]|jgi:GNAT superfamily N-acetyltransferase|nr:GNAT family N-acetyltransferase [Gemmataceae bacterium]